MLRRRRCALRVRSNILVLTPLPCCLQSYETNALFPDQCASSIAGRAVANSNKHPAPNRFRPFSAPKVFDVIRKRRQNDTLLSELAQRLSISHISPSTAVGGSHTFITELLPAMRIISPNGKKTSLHVACRIRPFIISFPLVLRWSSCQSVC